MTSSDRRQALLAQLAADLEAARRVDRAADDALKLASIAEGRMAPSTVCRVLQAKDHRISTLVEIADALNCDVQIVILKRSA